MVDTYEKLTSAINQAKEEGDIDLLREIASDPDGFILRQGWTSLDFSDANEIKSLRKLFGTLQTCRSRASTRQRGGESKGQPPYEGRHYAPEGVDSRGQKEGCCGRYGTCRGGVDTPGRSDKVVRRLNA